MSHYEQRLQRDLADIHARFGKIAAEVETAIADALRTVLTCDEDAARQFETIYRDLAVRIDDLMQVLAGVGEA